jgi:predicted DNA-binding ribbon-helix-helix protein
MGPVKRSVTIAGHETSISLEPAFWDALREEAEAKHLPLNALIARIDAARIAASDPPNLASAIRVWLFDRVKQRGVSAPAGSAPGPQSAPAWPESGG